MVQIAFAGFGRWAAPTAPVPSHVTLVPEAQVGVQVAIPPTISKELPGTTVVTEAPLRVVTYGR